MTKQEKQLLFFLPIFNLLCGVSIDLYAPALPDITNYFAISEHIAQATITIMIIGFAIGQFIFGFLSDLFGRYKTTILSLVIYILAVMLLISNKSVETLLISRFIQGLMCGSFAVNSRAIAMDKFKGNSFKIVIVYISLAWGIGPIISPYIGGLLATYINWQSIFISMLIYGVILLIFSIKVIDNIYQSNKSITEHLNKTKEIILNKGFLSRTTILGLCFSQGVIFNIIAPFWVVNIFGKSPSFFGTAALILGTGYFIGTLLNKFLINTISSNKLILFGLIIGAIGSIMLSEFEYTSIYTIAMTIAFINFGAGFVFANIMADNMSKFLGSGGIFSALQGSLMLIIGFCVAFLVSILNQPAVSTIGEIFFFIVIIQIIVFFLIKACYSH